MYFIVFLYGIVWVLNINKYSSDFNCNESKYCNLELKMEFWHKKPFSICFVHKFRKFSNFEPTFDYIMLRNFGTVRPIFPKIAPKVAQSFKEKSNESSRRENKFPPALLGLRQGVGGGGGKGRTGGRQKYSHLGIQLLTAGVGEGEEFRIHVGGFWRNFESWGFDSTWWVM